MTRKKTLLVAATHRSGSFLVSDWLSQMGGIPFAEEYFNFKLLAARQELRLSDDLSLLEVLERLIAHQRATSGVFVVKSMWLAFESMFTDIALEAAAPVADPLGQAFDILGDVRVLFVRRRDKKKQAVSFEKAKQQEVWRSETYDASLDATLVYSYPRILDCWKQIQEDEAAWLAFFESRQLPYHEIWYEDMVRDPMGVVGGALRFLGIEPVADVVLQSRYQKLSGGLNAEWLERFLRRHDRVLPAAENTAAAAGAHLIPPESAPAVPPIDLKCLIPESLRMAPNSAYVVECELSLADPYHWLPVLRADGVANYHLELRGEVEGSGDQLPVLLWRAELEALPGAGEVVSVALRLAPGMVFDDFNCRVFFCYPGGELGCGEGIQVRIELDEKWAFLKRVFGELSASDMSDWVNVPVLGDIWTAAFPFIYQCEHGWLYTDTLHSSPGIFCCNDFELGYFVINFIETISYYVWINAEPQQLEFLGNRHEQRKFRNPLTGEVLTYALSAKPEAPLDEGEPVK